MTADQARLMRTLARWHRRLATFVVAWLVLLAISGLLINHASGWGLDRKPLAAGLQRTLYGIEPEGAPFCESAPATGDGCADIFSALPIDSGMLLLSEYSLFLLDANGLLLEKFPVAQTGLPTLEAGLERNGALYLRGGDAIVRTGPDLLEFRLLTDSEVAALDDENWQGRVAVVTAVTWERFLLDLHAARFLGSWAVWFNDVAAALILVLAASGAWLGRLKRKANGR
ncbi:MAG: hypothetical protein HKO85_07855 [Xanthomonadales bacterium]|nr:PepSY domain-containing protein [Gammaproteobacteria bacterium]MBT8050233.1 PepSY domain-containing protein [Gammaproteobacteria bacterium]MBT8056582.1 PepSY domain-containing protein [Gammaproteobacteria bacterium]NNJ79452.1 hypothetical protein [Xanthomonadales bacterium]NNL05190.1 hypothetical protein [Xanthomonadales bacterium]